MITIDFETRSKVNLKTSGTWRYAEDPSTDVLCMAYAYDDGPVKLWLPGEPCPFALEEMHTLEAHNAFFERAIWHNVMVPKYHFWPVNPEAWRCSAAKAAAQAIPRSLEGACNAIDAPIKKNKDGQKTMLKLCQPNKKGEWEEEPKDLEKLYAYCKDDVEAERALSGMLRDLTEHEQQVWHLDQLINERGVRVDLPSIKRAIEIGDEYIQKMNERLAFLTGNAVEKATETQKLTDWLNANGHDVSGVTKKEVAELLEDNLSGVVREVLTIRQLAGKTSVAKYKKIMESVCADGRLRDLLMYHGAATGRWAGKGVQPQNLPRNTLEDTKLAFKDLHESEFSTLYPNVMETLSCMLRGIFIPSEGHTFFGGDYSAIEARVLLWLADDTTGLQMFRDGIDLYVELAKKIYGKDTISKDERFLGKTAILGCGYGMGATKFMGTCAGQGVEIEEDMAEKAVHAYRAQHSKVRSLWYNQESAAVEAVKTGKVIRCGKVRWGVVGRFLYCVLPSGRAISYCDPEIEPRETPWGELKDVIAFRTYKMGKFVKDRTYGGKIVENITQAVARDIMAHAMIKCENAGYKIALSIHDELLTEKEEGTVEELEALMSDLPEWADGLPVAVEGWSGVRYEK